MTATVVAVTALHTFYGQAATVTITDHPGDSPRPSPDDLPDDLRMGLRAWLDGEA
jgi:hypothetical protein